MPEVLEFEVPLPPAEASPNLHTSRLARIRALAGYRQLVARLARQALAGRRWDAGRRQRLSLCFRLGRGSSRGDGCYRPGDPDNAAAAAKPLIDGLVDAGLIEDDCWRWLELGAVTAEEGGDPGVAVRLEAAE